MRDLAPTSPRRSRSRLAVPAVVALALAVAAASGPAQADTTTGATGTDTSPAVASGVQGPIGHEGRWLTDAQGRVVLLNGVNMVAKGALTPDGRGFGADDADFLVANGFDVVRLGLSPDAFMPTPGKVDQAYLASYAQTVETLTDRGLLVLVDLHQDGWGPATCGNGFPAWMTLTHGAENTCTGFPLYYITNPAIQAAFDSFWDNEPASDGIGLQDHVATMFGALAGAVGDDDGVLGYDILNEPWPGTVWQSCATDPAGCPVQDAEGLDELHGKVTEAIRAVDGEHLVFGEPYVLFNFGIGGTNITLPGGDPDSGLSFHVYPADPSFEPAVLANAIAWSHRTGGALINTEFGATDDVAAIRRLIGEMDRALMPWMWWSYDENVVRDIRRAPTGDNVNEAVRAALVRPHAVAVAGTPTQQVYDPDTRVLNVSWTTTAPGAGAGTLVRPRDTLIRVPAPVYESGYQVDVVGGEVTSAAGSSALTVRAVAGAASVSVVVRPAVPVISTTTSTPPSDTSTSSPSTTSTSTTAMVETTTSAVTVTDTSTRPTEVPTTSVPAPASRPTGAGLPRTGTGAVAPLLAMGSLLATVGGITLVVARRRRLAG